MKLINDKLGINAELKEDFTQAQFEQYQNELINGAEKEVANSVIERVLVQAAINSGILTGVTEKLEEATPKVIRWLTVKVKDFIDKETEVPQD